MPGDLKATASGCSLTPHMNNALDKSVEEASVKETRVKEAGVREAAVKEANKEFYKALESGSIEKMDAVWLHEEWVRCVHPGWDMVKGWSHVRDTWDKIFEGKQKMRVSPENLSVQMHGDFSWVTCTENITVVYEASFDTVQAVATNLFIYKDGRWLMAHHHASSIPMMLPDAVTDTIQ
jgi:ketosteroid isomerase-like protein